MADVQPQQTVRTVWWEEDAQGVAICLIDQSLLPQQVIYLRLTHEQEIAEAIKTLKVRGAPAIGVTAAFGITLACYRLWHEYGETLTICKVQEHLDNVAQLLRHTRPTAVNLFWAIERMQASAHA